MRPRRVEAPPALLRPRGRLRVALLRASRGRAPDGTSPLWRKPTTGPPRPHPRWHHLHRVCVRRQLPVDYLRGSLRALRGRQRRSVWLRRPRHLGWAPCAERVMAYRFAPPARHIHRRLLGGEALPAGPCLVVCASVCVDPPLWTPRRPPAELGHRRRPCRAAAHHAGDVRPVPRGRVRGAHDQVHATPCMCLVPPPGRGCRVALGSLHTGARHAAAACGGWGRRKCRGGYTPGCAVPYRLLSLCMGVCPSARAITT